MDARRKALEAMEKPELIEIVLRLQEQCREQRTLAKHSLEAGIAEGIRRGGAAIAGVADGEGGAVT